MQYLITMDHQVEDTILHIAKTSLIKNGMNIMTAEYPKLAKARLYRVTLMSYFIKEDRCDLIKNIMLLIIFKLFIYLLLLLNY